MITQTPEGKYKVKGSDELFDSGPDAVTYLRTSLAQKRKEKMAQKGLYGPTSFTELDEARMAWEEADLLYWLVADFTILVDNIVYDPETQDIGSAVRQLANEFADRVDQISTEVEQKEATFTDRVSSALKSVLGIKSVHTDDEEDKDKEKGKEEEDEERVVESKQATEINFYKSGDQLKWVARYSNNFLDDDSPQEIISKESHQKHVALVKAGLVDPPDLWLWHEPSWHWGTGEWVTLDEQGDVVHTLAGGYVHPGYEELADVVSKDNFGVSHGMPQWSVSRSQKDSTIIVEHITEEVSPLPMWAAANKFTGFTNYSKEANMIPTNEKERLLKEFGVSPELLSRLEQASTANTQKAATQGREYKEGNEEVATEESTTEATTEVEVEVDEEVETTETEVADGHLKEADAIAIVKSVTALADQVKALTERMDAQEATVEDAVAQKAAETPFASLLAHMTKAVSPIGSEEAVVDKRTKMSKSQPTETPSPTNSRTGIPMVDGWLNGTGGS